MKSFNSIYTDFATISKDDSTANAALGKKLINYHIRKILTARDWSFDIKSATTTTEADKQCYALFYDCEQVTGVKVNSGGVDYSPKEIVGEKTWRKLNRTIPNSDIPQFWHINVDNKLCLYPEPSSGGKTMTIYYKKRVKDLSLADVTTGTVNVDEGSVYIVGTGTPFSSADVGKWIKVDDDPFWYEISAYYGANQIEIARKYGGKSTSADTYTIGEMIPLPDGYEDLPLWAALANYFTVRESPTTATMYRGMFIEGFEQLLRRETRTGGVVLEDESHLDDWGILQNINEYPRDLG